MAVALALGWAARAGATTFAVIAHADVPVDGVSISELHRLFGLDQRHWKNGAPVGVLLPGSGAPARDILLGSILHMSELQLRQMILGKIYRGEISFPPRVPASDRETVDFVAAAKGMIALVPASFALDERVRTLRVDGKLPDDPDYSLKR
jgi:hypothetical protein